MTSDPRTEQREAVLLEKLLRDLRDLREDLDLSQREVARRMGCSRSQVSFLESGKRPFHLSTLQTYVRALGAQLTFEVEPPQRPAPTTVTATLGAQEETQ